MINNRIDAIFFDHGNTMHIVVKDESFQRQAEQQLLELIGSNESLETFFQKMDERYTAYKKRAKETLLQASATDLWTHWMLPEYPADKIAPLTKQLTMLWRDCKGHRVPRPNLKQTIIELHQRGYILGIIANSLSETEIPDWLESEGLTKYFKSVVISSTFGRRKPDPYIYLEAAYVAGVQPEHCAYVGDNPNRDIQGAERARFGATIILSEPDTLRKDPPTGEYRPSLEIREIGDLLKHFLGR